MCKWLMLSIASILLAASSTYAQDYTPQQLLVLVRAQREKIETAQMKMTGSSTRKLQIEQQLWFTKNSQRADYRIAQDGVWKPRAIEVIGFEGDHAFKFTDQKVVVNQVKKMREVISVTEEYSHLFDPRMVGLKFGAFIRTIREGAWHDTLDMFEKYQWKIEKFPNVNQHQYLIVANIPRRDGTLARFEVTIDPNWQFSITDITIYHNQMLRFRQTCSGFQRCPEIAFPSKFTFTEFNPDGTCEYSETIDFSKVQLNQPIAAQVFRREGLNLPSGTGFLQNGNTRIWDGSKMVARETYVENSRGFFSPPDPYLPIPVNPPSQRHWYWLGGTLLLGVMLLGYGVMRRVRRVS